MSNEIVINTTPEETRVALLENKTLTELYFDRKRDRGILGNIYKGVVEKVLPGMQAAFVDIGTEKAAFLYVADVITEQEANAPFTEEAEAVEFEEGWEEKKEEEEAESMDESMSPQENDTTVPVIPRIQRRGHPSIEALLKQGQEVVVQVSKGPIGTKGPRVTTYISLPGRYLVYMPQVNHLGISRQIGREEERHRLKDIISRLRKPKTGYIVRTVSEGMTETEVKNDIEFLELVWQDSLKKRDKLKAPALLHTDLDLVFRTARDLFTKEIDRFVIDSKPDYERIKDFVGTSLPSFASRVELWEKDEPIFEVYGLEDEIVRAKNRRVWLKSGGYLVIDRAEALTVIDVNTGRFVGKKGLEETIFKTNMEAAKEIAWQLRLRNIGGIIIIDFIDMKKEKHKESVFNTLVNAVSTDKAKTNILKISDLGLVEMSRERTREALLRVLCEPCSYCEGRGYTKAPTTICYEIFREIRRLTPSASEKKIVVAAHPTIVGILQEQEHHGLDALERSHHKKIILKADANFHIEQYDIYLL
ncbi:MAG: Rne/Rng family ribonuclease [Nitrospirae bacterium]|nr:Rne/Rng family ribonuclease [Candidatus Troglogloeales bacterium]